jgi:hypothetical protein
VHVEEPFDPSPGFGVPLFQTPVAPVKREPVYWGWGGKLRPDAWQPTEVSRPERRHPKTPDRN